MGLTSSNQSARPTSSLPVIGKGEYEAIGCVDLMVAAESEDDCGLFARIFYPASPSHESREDPVHYPLWKPRYEYLNGLADYRQMSPRKITFFFDWIVGERRVPAGWKEPLYSRRLERADQHLNTSMHGSQSAVELSEKSGTESRVPHSHSAQCIEETAEPTFPVILFTHGISGHRACYQTFCSSLASYGYVVVAIEHRDRSASWSYTLETDPISGIVVERPIRMTTYPDGEAEFRQRNRQMHHRVGECLRAFSVMEELNSGIAGPIDQKPAGSKIIYGYDFDWVQFKGRLEMSKAAVIGHSFGAAAAIAAAAFSTDFRTAVSLDGWLYPIENDLYPRATQPTLFINASKWQWPENVKRMFQLQERVLFTFKDIVHQSFSDFAYLMPGYLGRKFALQGELDPCETGEAILEMVVAHLRRCFGQDGPDLSVVAARYEHFVFEGTDLDTTRTDPPVWNPNAPPPELGHLNPTDKTEVNGTTISVPPTAV